MWGMRPRSRRTGTGCWKLTWRRSFCSEWWSRRGARGLMSDEHFTVDGTLLDAWASLKSFQPKNEKRTTPPDDPGNRTVNFHGERRSNQTHSSKTDPDAQLARKGPGEEAKLSYSGNLLVENRNGLIVNAELWKPTAARNGMRRC